MSYIFITLEKLKGFIFDNAAVIGKALAAIWFFFTGIHMYLYAVIALTIADVVTGVLASLKKGEPFKSRILRKGLLEKTALYLLLVLVVFVLDLITQSVFHHTHFYFSFIVTFLISVYETSSIMENVSVLRPQIPFIGSLVGIFKKLGQKTVENLEKNVDDIADTVTDFKKITEKKKEEPTEPSTDSTEGQEAA